MKNKYLLAILVTLSAVLLQNCKKDSSPTSENITPPPIDSTQFWFQSGLAGERINALAASSSDEIWVATNNNGGIYKSTNHGMTWSKVSSGDLTSQSIKEISINSAGHIFLVDGYSSIYRSVDRGNNWTKTSFHNTSQGKPLLYIDPSDHLFAATPLGYGGLYRSTDNGDNWARISLKDTGIGAITMNSNGHLFAAVVAGPDVELQAYDGVYRSLDGGFSWHRIGLTEPFVGTLFATQNGYIFAGSYDMGVYRSTDEGVSWLSVNTGIFSTNIECFATNNINHIFTGTQPSWGVRGGVYRSTDYGNNWARINSGLSDSTITCLAVSTNGYLFAGTDSGGVFRSVRSTQ